MIIDAHMHADTRPIEDFKNISIGGVKAVIACAHDPLEMKKSNVTIEHFNRLIFKEPKRTKKNGVKLYNAIGVHPRAIPEDYENVLKKLPEYMEMENVISIGEIGLETTDQVEQDVFIKQLKLADENNFNVIVHTPRTNKAEVTKTTTALIDEYIKPELVQLDHIDYSIVDMVIDKNYTLGITVQPQKMSVVDTTNMLKEYGCKKFVLDSDMSSAPSNPMSLPETKHNLELNDFTKKDIDAVCYKNVSNFQGLKL